MNKLGCKHYHTATNGQEAVDIYKRSPAECRYIFTDVSMPIMDGFEASRQIRKFEAEMGIDQRAIIIAVTALASDDAQKSAFGSGIDLFLTKPVKLKELGAVLQQIWALE